MRHRRSVLEVCLEVLRIIKNGTKRPTLIMYEAGISWKRLQEILKSMGSKGMINEIDPWNSYNKSVEHDKRTIRYYELTQKGENIINYFRGVEEVLGLEIKEMFK